jgi:predicted dehydrogenase/threonine dehydrogenase-like Zn-dependent dehydrogenase
MPRPTLDAGSVLVRVHFSLISAGTELAGLRNQAAAVPESTAPGVARVLASPARRYLLKAIRNPGKAARKLLELAQRKAASALARFTAPVARPINTPAGQDPEPATGSDLADQGWNVGYSLSGEVLAVGAGITDLSPGDLVACAGAGQANHADYVCVKRNLVCRIPAGCPLPVAATTTVGAIALQGVRRAGPQLGERVCVLGLGLIGQMTVQLLQAAGCTVFGLDLDTDRVAKARELGMAEGAIDVAAFKMLVRDRTGGRGADRTMITAASKSDALINLAMEVTRRKGTVVLVGDVGLNVAREQFYRKEIDLLMSTSYGPGRYDEDYEHKGIDYPFPYVRWTLNRNMQAYLELAAAGKITIAPLIEKTVSITEARETYQALAQPGQRLPLGVVIHYPEEVKEPSEPADAPRLTLRGHRPAAAGPIRFALVGAGAFGVSMLVPQLEKRKDRFFLKGIVSRDAVRGGNFARANRVEVLATDLAEVLKDPDFDLMVIATRHDRHATQVTLALKANKHVFVEKPLALTWEDLDRVITTYRSLAAPPLLMVGFNRRFSPAVRLLQEQLQSRRAPLQIHYRLNGGYISPDSWIQKAEGGGRNLGEACHMYDVFRFLTGTPVRQISASAINPGTLPYLRSDNFSAVLGYEDGSLATLVYSALGTPGNLGKERIEVFCDGEAYVIDDFRTLTRASDGKVLWQSGTPEKGHFEELSALGDCLADGREPPIPFDELVETSAVSLYIEDLIHERDVDNEQCHDAA